MAEKKILVVGSANIDFLLKTPYVPAEGETLVSNGTYGFVPGGKGANAAVSAEMCHFARASATMHMVTDSLRSIVKTALQCVM